jgi:hypothetical protein
VSTRLVLLLAWLLAGTAAAAQNKAWVPETRDTDIVNTVWTYLRHKDCAGAANALTVVVLREWPKQRLAACACAAGVPGAIRGDLEFSRRAEQFGLKGALTVNFKPFDGSFESDIRRATERALQRYARPEGIDPGWRSALPFNFVYVLR